MMKLRFGDVKCIKTKPVKWSPGIRTVCSQTLSTPYDSVHNVMDLKMAPWLIAVHCLHD